ncbi:MAG: hypothetical protein K0Q90_1371 [Paenibacillaceae bacterium]|jgi:MFS family permease|nr:hypothetical protein [Paenibacillaceae bacterium]
MDTIASYLDNMLASLPRTRQMLSLKQEGKTENEAVSIVISEFGNIDELLAELDIPLPSEEPALPEVTEEEALDFMETKKKSGRLIGIGVFMCLAGVALLVLISTLVENNLIGWGLSEDAGYMVGLAGLFALIVPAIGIFIYAGTKLEKYKYLQGEFILAPSLKRMIQNRKETFASTYTLSLISGVCLAVFSPVAIFIASAIGDESTTYGVSIMLPLVGIAVFLFIYYGSIRESYNMLLQQEDFTKEKKEENRVIGTVASVVWPLATCVFLVSGFIYGRWEINWVIFPITASCSAPSATPTVFGRDAARYRSCSRPRE